MDEAIVLKYVGDGSALLDVPARDLTGSEVKACPMSKKELIASGLYQAPDAVPQQPEQPNQEQQQPAVDEQQPQQATEVQE